MTAKRDAHLAEVAAADRAEGARAARIPTRPISIHLTPFAPDLSSYPIGHKRRWVTLYGRTPNAAIRALLTRLRLRPEAVTTATVNGDVDVMAPVPPEFLDLVSGNPSEPAPFAVIWDGLSEPEVRAELDTLIAHRWAPAHVSEYAHA